MFFQNDLLVEYFPGLECRLCWVNLFLQLYQSIPNVVKTVEFGLYGYLRPPNDDWLGFDVETSTFIVIGGNAISVDCEMILVEGRASIVYVGVIGERGRVLLGLEVSSSVSEPCSLHFHVFITCYYRQWIIQNYMMDALVKVNNLLYQNFPFFFCLRWTCLDFLTFIDLLSFFILESTCLTFRLSLPAPVFPFLLTMYFLLSFRLLLLLS